MKITGFVLLVSGAVIVIAAVALVSGTPQNLFILAGIAIEIGGFVLTALSHRPRGGSAF